MKIQSLFYLTFFMSICSSAQIIPPDVVNDPSWTIVNNVSDEFNTTTVDNAKWNWQPPWSSLHGHPGSSQACLSADLDNRSESSGRLKLSITDEVSTCADWDGTPYSKDYTTGAMWSQQDVKYGYFEIKVRIPDHNSQNTSGPGPNFWLWPKYDWSGTYPDIEYSEIDIFEFDASNNRHTCNVHYEHVNMASRYVMRQDGSYDIENSNFSNSQWHVYSCLWTPEIVTFFVDGTKIRSMEIPNYASGLIPMHLVIDINTPYIGAPGGITSSTTLPYDYEIDYVRVYQLDMDCNTVINSTIYNVNSYDHKVKKSITFGGGGNVTSVAANSGVFMRATDFIEISGDFTVPLGAEFLADIEECY